MWSSSLLAAVAILALSARAVTAARAEPTGTCYALAMAGGGDRAAYEAGVLRGLTGSLPADEVAYQCVSGISAGSTLTAAFSVFPVGQESGVVDLAYEIIAGLNQSSIFTQWPGGVTEGFLHHSSMFDSTPLRRTFSAILAGRTLAQDRVTCMGVANLQSGQYERLCKHDSIEAVVNATLATAAIPGVFLAQTLASGETYIDGGTLVNVDVSGAILSCLDLGYSSSQITVDIIECHRDGDAPEPLPSGHAAQLTTLPIMLRAQQM